MGPFLRELQSGLDDLIAAAQIGPYDHITTSEWSALHRVLRGPWRKRYVVPDGRDFSGR